jgi:hypothetical protein
LGSDNARYGVRGLGQGGRGSGKQDGQAQQGGTARSIPGNAAYKRFHGIEFFKGEVCLCATTNPTRVPIHEKAVFKEIRGIVIFFNCSHPNNTARQ